MLTRFVNNKANADVVELASSPAVSMFYVKCFENIEGEELRDINCEVIGAIFKRKVVAEVDKGKGDKEMKDKGLFTSECKNINEDFKFPYDTLAKLK